MRRHVGGSLIVLGLLTLPAFGEVRISWQLNPGDKFYLEIEHRTRQVIHLQEREIRQEMVNTSISQFEVVEKLPEGFVLRQKVESVQVQAGGPGAGDGVKLAQQLEGSVFTITFDARMRVARLEGYDTLLQKLAGDNAALRKMVASVLNEETLKDELNHAFGGFLPDDPVSPGDRWQRGSRVVLGPLGKFQAAGAYTYQGRENDLDRIDAAWSLTYTPPTKDEAGLPFRVVRGGLTCDSARGVYWFNDIAGRLVQSERQRTCKGTLTLDVAGTEMPMQLEQETVTKHRLLDRLPSMK